MRENDIILTMKTSYWNESISVKWVIILLVLSLGVGFFSGIRYADHLYLKLQQQGKIGNPMEMNLPEGHPDISKGSDGINIESIQASISGLEKLLKKDSRNVTLMIHLGNLYADAQKQEKAINIYEQALKIDPNLPEVWVDCGVMHRELNHIDKAETYFNKALSFDSAQPFAYYNLGIVYAYDLKQPQKAIGYWEKLIQLHPESPISLQARKQILDLKTIKK
jgi:tetratricopeptide (TPR) repeat protein